MRTPKIRIGFDYDEPLFPWYQYAHEASVAAGLTTPDDPPPTVWDPHSVYGCTLQEWFDVLDAEVAKGFDGMYARPLDKVAVEAVRRLYDRGYEIHIVTARGQFGSYGKEIQRLTYRQLILENVPYTSVHFTENKGAAIMGLGIDYFIDDREKYYLEAEDAGAKVYLLDRPWNQDFAAERRVYSTKEYADIVMNTEQLVRPTGTIPSMQNTKWA